MNGFGGNVSDDDTPPVWVINMRLNRSILASVRDLHNVAYLTLAALIFLVISLGCTVSFSSERALSKAVFYAQ